MIRLFVYGTLRRGQRNYRMMRGARFLGGHRTEAGYSMHDLGGFPGVCRPGRRAVAGELFVIDAALLARLDRFEAAYGVGGRIEIATPHGPAWMYVIERGFGLGKPSIAGWRQKKRPAVAGRRQSVRIGSAALSRRPRRRRG